MNSLTAKEPVNKKISDLNPVLWPDRYADYLYSFALLRVNDEDQAKDLVQDTFLAALENINSFGNKSAEKTWLTGILRNKIFDFYGRQLKHSSHEEAIPCHFFRKEDGHWNIDQRPIDFGSGRCEVLENKECQRILLQCMQKMPVIWQPVFKLKHMEDISTNAICEQLSLTPANFWVIMHRAKLNLRSCLQKNL